MKLIKKYHEFGINNEHDAFHFFIKTLKSTVFNYDYFVEWQKVFSNISQIEVELNILNSLIGKNNIKNRLKELIKRFPSIILAIPLLIAVRSNKLAILDNNTEINYYFEEESSQSEKN